MNYRELFALRDEVNSTAGYEAEVVRHLDQPALRITRQKDGTWINCHSVAAWKRYKANYAAEERAEAEGGK